MVESSSGKGILTYSANAKGDVGGKRSVLVEDLRRDARGKGGLTGST